MMTDADVLDTVQRMREIHGRIAQCQKTLDVVDTVRARLVSDLEDLWNQQAALKDSLWQGVCAPPR